MTTCRGDKAVLTAKEASKRLGISVALVYREIQSGRLECFRFGKRTYRISEEQLEDYLMACSKSDDVDGGGCIKVQPPGDWPRCFSHVDVSRLLSSQNRPSVAEPDECIAQ